MVLVEGLVIQRVHHDIAAPERGCPRCGSPEGTGEQLRTKPLVLELLTESQASDEVVGDAIR